MSLITLTDASKHFGAELIFAGASFRLDRGDHVALVGVNGAGKSTLLRIIAGLEEPDSGSVGRAHALQVAYLSQEPDFEEDHTLYEALLDVFAEAIAAQERLRALEEQMAGNGAQLESAAGVMEEYGRLQAFVEHVGYDYRQRIERVLLGLGLARDHWYTPVAQLSGGQRTRASLARTLLRDADLLLLDEPTNHLDIPAVEWLEAYLRDLKSAFLIVAHDRYLLDRVTTRTLELSFHRLTAYDAPYSRYLVLRSQRMERQRLEYEAQQRHIAKTEDYVRRYGAGQRAREARGRQKRLDRLDRIEAPQEESSIALRLSQPKRSGDIVLELRHLIAGYPGKPLVQLPEETVVRRGERIAVIGPNGAGKTTLLRTLVGSLQPLEGSVRWGARTGAGYYSQTLAQLDERRNVLEEIQRVRAMSEEEGRSYLGRFLFSGDDVFKSVGVLSGGERSRVALARLILEEPNVLILDEPTNHLDIASRDALEAVLAEFAGTLLFVSHDRFLIDSLAEQVWVVKDGTLTRYGGGYTAYISGKAKSLDRVRRSTPQSDEGESVETRVRRLEDEAETLAGRLAQLGLTASTGQLGELTDRYAELLEDLQEAQREWTTAVRKEFRASSDSRDQSAAASRR